MPQVAEPVGPTPAVEVPHINVTSRSGRNRTRGPLVLKGRQGKTAIVQEGYVRIIKAGSVLAAQREKTIPIRNIASVEVKKPGAIGVGFIQFSIAGGAVRESSFTFTGGAFDAVQDENSVVFADTHAYEIALRIKQYVESYGGGSGQAARSDLSAADEIIKLKALMDQGVITAEEFELKKRQLLDI